MDINEFRKQNPVYDDMSDGALAYGLYQKNYTDMPMGEFADKINLSSEGFKQMITTAKEKGRNVTSSSTTKDGPGNQAITGFNQQDQSFVNPNMEAMGIKEGLLSSTAQGITAGWSDEIIGHMGAITQSLGGSELSYDDLYTRMKEFEEKRISDFRKTNPKSAFASEVGGAIATSVAATPAMALLKSPKFLMDLSAGMKAFITSGGVGAIYGAGTGEEGERAENALKVGTVSAFGGFLLQKPMGYISSKYDKLVTKANQSPTIQNLKEAKNTAYDEAKKLGIKFEGAILERFRNEGLDSLDESYDPLLNKYTASAKKLFEDVLDDAYIEGISFEKLDLLQRQLWAKLKESGGQEIKIYPFINAVNNLIKSHPDTSAAAMAAKSANAIYNKAKAVDWEFTKVLNNKEITGSIGKKYKMAVRNILNNKNLRNNFDDVDIKTMESFLKGNISDKMLGTIGKLSPTNGGFIAMLQLGAVAFNPAVALASAVAVASKSSFNKRASQGAEKLLNYIKQFKPDTPINSAVPGGAAAGSGQALDQLQ